MTAAENDGVVVTCDDVADDAQRAAIAAALVGAGIELLEMETPRRTLEQVFLDAVRRNAGGDE